MTRKILPWDVARVALSRSRLNERTGCIEWQGRPNSNGYGFTAASGQTYANHRAVYADAHGPIPDGVHVLHLCDNRICLNLNHLYGGSNLQNIADKMQRDRSGKKLRIKDVQAIKRRLSAGESQTSIARDYSVHSSQISFIKTGRHWAHVNMGDEQANNLPVAG